MNHISLKTIPVLGFGTASISSMRSYGEVMKLLNAAYSEGIRHFDTAPLYGRGYSEKLMGEFAKHKRQNLLIATKFGLGSPDRIRIPPSLALPLNYYSKKWRGVQPTTLPAAVIETNELPYRCIRLHDVKNSLEASLQRLQTNYVDYYFLHEALPGFLEPGVLEFLLLQKEKGRIRFLGVATGAANLVNVNSSDFDNWDILQYEAGPLHEKLQHKYPNKQHFLHSALKDIGNWRGEPGIPTDERGGFLLARYSKTNGSGKLLFSTRRINVLHKNLQAFQKYITLMSLCQLIHLSL